MIIRQYQSSDCGELAKLFYNTVHAIDPKYYTKEQKNVWATGKIDLKKWDESFQKHDSLVAIDEGMIIGFGDISHTGYLDRLYVHPNYQNKGVATAICDRLEQKVTGRIVTHASLVAKPFFIKRGYKVVQMNEKNINTIIDKNLQYYISIKLNFIAKNVIILKCMDIYEYIRRMRCIVKSVILL